MYPNGNSNRQSKIVGEELCLAADVILSITATEDIKNCMMGGPPLIHLIGLLTRRWFEKDLLQTLPYLLDLHSGQSLVAWSVDQVGPKIIQALSPDVRRELLARWQPPKEKSAKRMADELIKIAGS